MALDAIISSIEGLPEAIAAEYSLIEDADDPNKGKYILKVRPTGNIGIGNVGGLTTAVERYKTELEEKEAKLKAFGDLTPDAARDALAKVEEFAQLDPDEMAEARLAEYREQADRKIQEIEHKYTTQVTEANRKITTLDSELFDTAIHNAAVTAIQRNNPNNNVTLLLDQVKKHLRPKLTSDGRHGYVVIDELGNERLSDPIAGTPMTVDELVANMADKPEYAPAFAAKVEIGGSGTPLGSNDPHHHVDPSQLDWQQAPTSDKVAAISTLIAANK